MLIKCYCCKRESNRAHISYYGRWLCPDCLKTVKRFIKKY